MAYAEVSDIQARLNRALDEEEQNMCETLLEDAAVIIDAFNVKASEERKKLVSCKMVIRTLGDGTQTGIPIGASQGSISALGYSQSWTVGSGSTGELYLSKLEKQLLGLGNRIGSKSPVEDITPDEEEA